MKFKEANFNKKFSIYIEKLDVDMNYSELWNKETFQEFFTGNDRVELNKSNIKRLLMVPAEANGSS